MWRSKYCVAIESRACWKKNILVQILPSMLRCGNLSSPQPLCREVPVITKDGPVVKIKLRKIFGGLQAQQAKWGNIMKAAARMRSRDPGHVSSSSHLTEIESF